MLMSPYPYFGGKSKVATVIWKRFGEIQNFVEPFFGSGACLLYADYDEGRIETVNDKDGYIANFWRAVQSDPEQVAYYADAPVFENDLHARHIWLVNTGAERVARLEGDPDYYDAKVAGWWVWGMACWIGVGFCSGTGPWTSVDGQRVHLGNAGRGVTRQLVHLGNAGQGVNRGLVHLGNAGRGVNRGLVHLGDAGRGVNRKRVHLGDAGQGVNRGLVHLGNAGRGVNRKRENLYCYFDRLAERMRHVRVCCGDWSRVCGPTPTIKQGITGVFLDPPYGFDAGRDMSIYRVESGTVARDVLDWCKANTDEPLLRIALCGYECEHDELEELGWSVVAWKANGGYSNQNGDNKNKFRERVWFSPSCLTDKRIQQQFVFDAT